MNQPLIDYLALLEENKRLTEGKELDNQFIIDLGRQLKAAQEKIKKLEAELNELRLREESDTPRIRPHGAPLSGTHVRSAMLHRCHGD